MRLKERLSRVPINTRDFIKKHPAVATTIVGTTVIAAIVGVGGGYFFPRPEETITPPVATATPTPSEAAGTPTPTRTPEPTKTPTPRPTETPRPTATATARPKEQLSPAEAHARRLIALNQTLKQQGIGAWLEQAGISGGISISKEARQIEEEVIDSNGQLKIVASGMQVSAENLTVNWPAVITTDQPGVKSARSFQPDKNNPSTIYTDVTNYMGNATLWVDGQNWRQLAPEK